MSHLLKIWILFPLDLSELLLRGPLQAGAWLERRHPPCQFFQDTIFKEVEPLVATGTPQAGLGQSGSLTDLQFSVL